MASGITEFVMRFKDGKRRQDGKRWECLKQHLPTINFSGAFAVVFPTTSLETSFLMQSDDTVDGSEIRKKPSTVWMVLFYFKTRGKNGDFSTAFTSTTGE